MTVFLTGGSGFLGSHIAEQLSRKGVPVRALVRKTSNTSFLSTLPAVQVCSGSLYDQECLLPMLEGVTAVVHCAGLVKARSEAEFMHVNATGTEQLLEAVLRKRAGLRRFVFVSSLAAVGPSDHLGTPLGPEVVPHPVTAYGRSKRAAERALLAARDELPVTILRPSAVYGPRDHEILAFFKAVAWGVLPYMGSDQNRLSIVYSVDAALACIAALEADVPSGSSFFVDDGQVYTFGDLFQAVETALGRRAWLRLPLPRRLVETVAMGSELYGKIVDKPVMLTRDKCHELFAQWVTDSKVTMEALKWRPEVTMADGIRRTCNWYREQGWI